MAIDRLNLLENSRDLLVDLLRGTEDVRIVLNEGSYAEEAVRCAARLVAVNPA